MKNKRTFHFSVVSVLFLSFLLMGVTVASAAPNVQNAYSTDTASTVILTGTPPTQVGVVVSGVTMLLNITAQTGNLYSGTLDVGIPTIPTTTVTALITGFITDGGKMTMTIVDLDTGIGIGTMTATKDKKNLKNGVMQLFGGSVTSFVLKKAPTM
jgi:hypothetical protein